MFCPKCSHEMSEDMRYCPRCRFQMNIVKDLLDTNGTFLKQLKGEKQEINSFVRREDTRIGAKLMFFGLIFAIPAFILMVIFDSPYPAAIALVPFLLGLAHILYNILFGERVLTKIEESAPLVFGAKEQLLNLPASQSIPLNNNDFNRFVTAEMVKPPSVTENTTNLFDKKNEI